MYIHYRLPSSHYTWGVVERVEFSPVLPESIPKPWEKGRQYWAYDLVSYEGKYYECWASYEKTPGSGSGTIGKFEPIDFSITVLAAYDMDRSFTFPWKTIRPILLSSNPKLVDEIEKGSANYSYSQLTYGLIEKDPMGN